jgi:hypothetical protein
MIALHSTASNQPELRIKKDTTNLASWKKYHVLPKSSPAELLLA